MKLKLHVFVLISILLRGVIIYGQNFRQLGGDIGSSASGRIAVNNNGDRVVFRNGTTILVYELNSSEQWVQLGSNVNEPDLIGPNPMMNAIGNRFIVGSQFTNGGGNENAGQAKIFELNASNQWVQLGGDLNGDAAEDRFASDFSISNDGTRIAISAPFSDSNGEDSGLVRVFQLNASNQWEQLGTDIVGGIRQQLGRKMSMNGLGNRIAVSIPFGNQVLVYELNASNQWVKLGNTIAEKAGSLAISDDGDTLILGNQASGSNGLSNNGQVKIFELNAANNWVQVGSSIEGEVNEERIGRSVSINNNGTKIVFSSRFLPNTPIKVFQKNISNEWEQVGTTLSASTDAVQMNGTGDRIVFSAENRTANVFEFSNDVPISIAPSVPSLIEDTVSVDLGDDIEVKDINGNDQTVTFTVTGGTLTLGSTGITFGGDGNGSASFTAQGTLTAINSALDVATFTPTSNLSGTNVANISFVTNNGIFDSNTASTTFSITSVNDAPSFNIPYVSDNNLENRPRVASIVKDINDGDEEAVQNLTFNVSNDNNSLFTVQPTIDATTGKLSYTTASGAYGKAVLTITLQDDGGTSNGGVDTSAAQTFNINVSLINRAPTFDLPTNPNLTITEDTGAQVVNGFAKNMDDGNPDKIQRVNFRVLNNNNELFSIQPDIDEDTGNLTYTPATNINGVATITVTLIDSGGTGAGGVDTSEEKTFTITVTPDNDILWDGDTNTSWTENANWENNIVPSNTKDIVIPNATNLPVIESGFTRNMNDLAIESLAGLTVNAGGSAIINGDFDSSGTVVVKSGNSGNGVFIVKGTANGMVTYERDRLIANEWSMISAPVIGQSIKEFVENPANDIRINTTVTPNRYAVAYYDDSKPAGTKWVYYTTDDLATNHITFEKGRGYIISRKTNGTVTFTGTLETENVRKSLVASQWNAIGNPYTALIPGNNNSANFITDNLNDLDPAYVGFYTWDNNQKKYVANLRSTATKSIVPGQGFFVKMRAGRTSVIFAEIRRNTQALLGGVFSRSTNEENIILSATTNNRTVQTTINFRDNSSLGLDPGYDAGNFDGASFDIFTRLANGSSNTNFTVQSLPNSEYKNLVIPVGVKAVADSEVIFSIASSNIPKGVEVYMEDKKTNSFTKLDSQNTFKVTFKESVNDTGRFYLHAKSNEFNNLDLTAKEINIYNSNTTITVEGISANEFDFTLYNTLGATVYNKTYTGKRKRIISIPSLETGMYIVHVVTVEGTKSKKIFVNK
ncbi:conserved protein of unknown function precursor containing a T9SS type A C-terminal secretion signal [Tenacibaculum sp. 190524A02b]|uniref:T9SS type A sorting domain-containing protein n=1 Tax=Tenacibaculum vairaonense TaxID=3137860 RepID=UPI0032B21A9A